MFRKSLAEIQQNFEQGKFESVYEDLRKGLEQAAGLSPAELLNWRLLLLYCQIQLTPVSFDEFWAQANQLKGRLEKQQRPTAEVDGILAAYAFGKNNRANYVFNYGLYLLNSCDFSGNLAQVQAVLMKAFAELVTAAQLYRSRYDFKNENETYQIIADQLEKIADNLLDTYEQEKEPNRGLGILRLAEQYYEQAIKQRLQMKASVNFSLHFSRLYVRELLIKKESMRAGEHASFIQSYLVGLSKLIDEIKPKQARQYKATIAEYQALVESVLPKSKDAKEEGSVNPMAGTLFPQETLTITEKAKAPEVTVSKEQRVRIQNNWLKKTVVYRCFSADALPLLPNIPNQGGSLQEVRLSHEGQPLYLEDFDKGDFLKKLEVFRDYCQQLRDELSSGQTLSKQFIGWQHCLLQMAGCLETLKIEHGKVRYINFRKKALALNALSQNEQIIAELDSFMKELNVFLSPNPKKRKNPESGLEPKPEETKSRFFFCCKRRKQPKAEVATLASSGQVLGKVEGL